MNKPSLPPPFPSQVLLPEDKPSKLKRRRFRYIYYAIAGVIFLAVILLPLGPRIARFYHQPVSAVVSTAMPVGINDKLSEIDNQVRVVSQRIDDLSERIKKIEADVFTLENTNTSKTNTDNPAAVAGLRQDLTAVTTAMDAMHEEIKSISTTAAQNQLAVQHSLTMTLAFVQLREAVLSGRKFQNELSTVKEASSKNTYDLGSLLDKLTPYAEQGVPTSAVLLEQFRTLETNAYRAIRKASARGWWDRLLVEFQSIITIRPLHDNGGVNSIMSGIETKLAANDLTAALSDLKDLPPEATDVFAAWRKNLENRILAEQALQDMALHIATLDAPTSQNIP